MISPPLRRSLGQAIDTLGLRGPVFRIRERLLARADTRAGVDDQGRPVPPPYLRTLVVGTPNLDYFLQSGRSVVTVLERILATHGGGFGTAGSVLEWGCGCGRLARWLPVAQDAELFGTDLNPKLIGWCRANLPGDWRVNGLRPPLPMPDGRVELVYAFSVLTHLSEATAELWMAELGRVIRPGGRALLTFSDSPGPDAPEVAEALARTGYAVRFGQLEGANNFAAYATADRLVRMGGDAFERLAEVSAGATGLGISALLLRRR